MSAPQLNSLPLGWRRASGSGSSKTPRSLELYNFLDVSEVNSRGKSALLVRSYKPGTLEPLQDLSILLDVILRRHLQKFSCSVEMDTGLRSFEQSDEGVTTILANNGISETFDTKWIIGAVQCGFEGIVRKQLGLTFLGETRDDTRVVTGDICLIGVGLDRMHWHRFGNFLEGANVRMVNKFGEGRVFVAGGMGLDSGVQDAFNLGWKLALVQKGIANKSLLETYSAERLPVISEMLETNIVVLDGFVASVKPINAYGVLDEGNLEADDRAPDTPNILQVGRAEPDATTLFGLYRPWYHTIPVFAPSLADATPILGALEAYDKSVVRLAVVLPSSASVTPVASPIDLIDREGYACSAYLVEFGQTKVFVIRPNGVIGAIVHGAEGVHQGNPADVKKYFSKIFFDT
ncbi:uncharacterized protein F5147DRAFT_744648 [Suillus discolor]|uniref:FAD-binding domain-containing protein n=1 Tax=Suillus discolor TaxID=1912936 RepID=A0A9P7JW82_9AGAM|nr:uncharacterized protein F5147DRAFT_744648 [Suillus discolor]KAG2111975.1 hypothetical protein F5147DRAFT_744648 [Suillus discolor]